MELINQPAPNFNLLDQEGKVHQLKDYKGYYTILYFYPKDLTPGCTIEANKFQANLDELKKRKAKVLGVSADDIDRHKKFCNKEGLSFPLLADTDHEVCKKYGVWAEKSMFGKKYMGINRETFLINPDGLVVKHYKKVKPVKHIDEILNDLDQM